jgi:hypothetical protein
MRSRFSRSAKLADSCASCAWRCDYVAGTVSLHPSKTCATDMKVEKITDKLSRLYAAWNCRKAGCGRMGCHFGMWFLE